MKKKIVALVLLMLLLGLLLAVCFFLGKESEEHKKIEPTHPSVTEGGNIEPTENVIVDEVEFEDVTEPQASEVDTIPEDPTKEAENLDPTTEKNTGATSGGSVTTKPATTDPVETVPTATEEPETIPPVTEEPKKENDSDGNSWGGGEVGL